MMHSSLRRALLPFLFFLPLFSLARIYYVADNLRQAGFNPWDANILFFPLFDFAALAYAFLPAAIIIALFSLPPLKRFRPKAGKIVIVATVLFLTVFSISELFFIQELNSRFNFIAVDYLVYTNEVLRNIWESYPIVWILFTITLMITPFTLWLFRGFFEYALDPKAGNRALKFPGLVIALAALAFFFVNEGKVLSTKDSVGGEIAKNGLHTLFFAFRNNEISYEKFYHAIDGKEATKIAYSELAKQDALKQIGQNQSAEDQTSIVRNISFRKPAKKLNVVLVLMESMSARFLGVYGEPKGLTPNLDRLVREGVWFSDNYASGTRTVRGIEAVMLSIPPTPGQSIVRREGGAGIFNLGTVLGKEGYSLHFVYGGHGAFDNMNGFFQSNGFEIRDEGTFPANEIHFSNAWGVADEDLFAQAIKDADAEHAKNKPFFQFILNTSNHRPFTYPNGRIDLPSPSGRDGAIKYSDFAIGKFIEDAKAKPWFKDTLFVFVADHNASVAGGTTILPSDYLIPVIFYAPAHLKPEKKAGSSAQIDIAPTILSVLGIPYQSRFWGSSLMERRPGRAFLAT
ncbi:MAG: LTA synthase family protein, partial [Bdellovibrionota bacterium]